MEIRRASSYILLYSFTFILIGCKSNINKIYYSNSGQCINIDIDAAPIRNSILYSSLFSDFHLVALETSKNCLIGHITQIEVVNDYLFILDNVTAQSLYVFNMKGKFLRKIGNLGKGPGEYNRISMFSIRENENQIFLLDGKSNKVLVFSFETGEFIYEFYLDEYRGQEWIAILNDDIYIDRIMTGEVTEDYYVSRHDLFGKEKAKLFPTDRFGIGFYGPVNTSKNFLKTNHELRYIKSLFDTIYTISKDTIIPFLTVNTSNNLTPKDIEEINKMNRRDLIKYLTIKCPKFLGITNYLETNEFISFKYKNNMIPYITFYYPLLEEVFITERKNLIDDLTFLKNSGKFSCTSENKILTVLENNSMKSDFETFISNCKYQRINLSESEIEEIALLSDESNPVIILYDIKNINDNSNLLVE